MNKELLLLSNINYVFTVCAGQVVNVLREEQLPHHMGFRPQHTGYVKIPAWYQSGVTLFIDTENSHYEHLKSMPELDLSHDWQKYAERDEARLT